jgi:hypothetical protein
MHFGLSGINILEPLSTAVLICNGFIPRRPNTLRRQEGCNKRLGWLDRGQLLTKEWA